MYLEDRWATYALIQAMSGATGSIAHFDAQDVRLDRLLDEIEADTPKKLTNIERAVQSYARRERSRQRTRRLTEHAFAPASAPDPEQTLIWKQTWVRFEQAFSQSDLRLLVQGEALMRSTPMTSAERTRICRLRSSVTYHTTKSMIFGQVA